jgi:outer membrane protein assembly factor BamB
MRIHSFLIGCCLSMVVTVSGWSQAIGSKKWDFTTGGTIYSSPAIGSAGQIYIGCDDFRLYAVNTNGVQLWSYLTGGRLYSSPAVALDGTIYVGSADYYLYAINPNGTLKWRYLTGYPVYSSPAIGSDGTVYVGSRDFFLHAVNPNGTLKWSAFSNGDIDASPVVGTDGTVYVGERGSEFFAAKPGNGARRWTQYPGMLAMVPAITAEGNVLVTSDSYPFSVNIRSYTPAGGTAWSANIVYGQFAPPLCSPVVGANGTIYVQGTWFGFFALNSSGSLLWSYGTGGNMSENSAPAIAADGTIYVGSGDNLFRAFNSNGTLRWSYTSTAPFYSSPAIAPDGTVYVGCNDHKLYAFVGGSPLAATAWPMLHRDARHTGNAMDTVMNVNFGSSTKTGPAATGKVSTDVWNNFSFPWTDTATVVNLKLSDNTTTGVGVKVQNGGGYWGNVSGDAMYDTYVYPNGNLGDGVGNVTVTVTNLAAGIYDFYLYGHGDSGGCPEEDTMFTLTHNGSTFGPLGTFSANGWVVSSGWAENYQYILFRGVNVAAGVPVVITAASGYNGSFVSGYCHKATINGIQMIKR